MPLQALKKPVRTRRSGQTNLQNRITHGAPVRGLTSQKSVAEMDPSDAIRMRNFIVKPFGAQLREGFIQHQNNFQARVNTLISHQARAPVNDRLFAVTFEGIYDATLRQENLVKPTAEIVFGTQTADITDVVSWVPFTNLGENFTCVVGEPNGYHTYDATSGWVDQTLNIVGADATTFDYVTNWKRRLWFVPEESTSAFYLPVEQIVGTVSEFDFGPYLRQGGSIKQLVSWTRDGGDGLDDFLIVIGSEGDVVVYQGSDPANADTFAMVGIWNLGSMPAGRRLAVKSGGDVKILCESGLIDLSELFQGAVNVASPESLGHPVQNTLASAVSNTIAAEQWEVIYYPRDELFIAKEPVTALLTEPQMWTANIHSRGWGNLNDLPQQTLVVFQNRLFGADPVGTVYQELSGDVDNLDFASNSDEITGNIQAGFSNYEQANLKKFQVVQATFQAATPPAYQIAMHTEFDVSALAGSPNFPAPSLISKWDDGIWDTAIWGGAANTYQAWAGVNGIGFYGSLVMNVRGRGGTVFTHWTLAFEKGGLV